MNIYQKLAEIRKTVEVMKRDAKGFGYTYLKEETILARITVGMKKHGLSLLPAIVPGTLSVNPYSYKKTKTTPKGDIYEENVNEVVTSADMVWTWVNNDDPGERIDVPWAMVGMQSDGSQSFGSGLTYASRYFLLKFFSIATSADDPDAFRGKQREAELEEDKLVAEQIIREVDAYIKHLLAATPDKRGELAKIIIKYVKSGDYFAIKESALAGKLMQEVTSAFPLPGIAPTPA
jgi:hypothetical protein